MYIFCAAIKIILTKSPRYIMFLLAAAALLLCFGALGRDILYSDTITDQLTVIIVDNDDSAESRMFTQMFQEYELYSGILNFTVAENEEYAYKSIEDNTAAAALILPEYFARDVMRGANEPFTLILNEAQYLKKTLVEYFAYAFSDILSASQSGIYAALDYTNEHYPESYNRMFRTVNIKFLDMVLNRADMYRVREYTVIPGLPFFTHFALSFLIFINLTVILLFTDILYENFNPFILKKLRIDKQSFILVLLQLILALSLALGVMNICIIAAARLDIEISGRLIAALLLTVICAAAFLVMVSYIFKNGRAASVCICTAALAGFFLSGGIIPREFFAPVLYNLSYYNINYWLYEAIAGAADPAAGDFAAGISVTGIMIIIFGAATVLCMKRAADKV